MGPVAQSQSIAVPCVASSARTERTWAARSVDGWTAGMEACKRLSGVPAAVPPNRRSLEACRDVATPAMTDCRPADRAHAGARRPLAFTCLGTSAANPGEHLERSVPAGRRASQGR